MVNLLNDWIKEGMIQGVCDMQGMVKADKWKGVEEWTKLPKVVYKKEHMLVEIIVSLKTAHSPVQLHNNQKNMCNEKR